MCQSVLLVGPSHSKKCLKLKFFFISDSINVKRNSSENELDFLSQIPVRTFSCSDRGQRSVYDINLLATSNVSLAPPNYDVTVGKILA